jgi:hypothetical protein
MNEKKSHICGVEITAPGERKFCGVAITAPSERQIFNDFSIIPQ